MALFGGTRGGQPLFMTPPGRQRVPFSFGEIPWSMLAYSRAGGNKKQVEDVDAPKALPGQLQPFLNEVNEINNKIASTEMGLQEMAKEKNTTSGVMTPQVMMQLQSISFQRNALLATKDKLEYNLESAKKKEAEMNEAGTGQRIFLQDNGPSTPLVPQVVQRPGYTYDATGKKAPKLDFKRNYEYQQETENIGMKWDPKLMTYRVDDYNSSKNYKTKDAFKNEVTDYYHDTKGSNITFESPSEVKTLQGAIQYLGSTTTSKNVQAVTYVKKIIWDNLSSEAREDVMQQMWEGVGQQSSDMDFGMFDYSESGKQKIAQRKKGEKVDFKIEDFDQDQIQVVAKVKNGKGDSLNAVESKKLLEVQKNYVYNRAQDLEPIYLSTSTTRQMSVLPDGLGDGTSDKDPYEKIETIFSDPNNVNLATNKQLPGMMRIYVNNPSVIDPNGIVVRTSDVTGFGAVASKEIPLLGLSGPYNTKYSMYKTNNEGKQYFDQQNVRMLRDLSTNTAITGSGFVMDFKDIPVYIDSKTDVVQVLPELQRDAQGRLLPTLNLSNGRGYYESGQQIIIGIKEEDIDKIKYPKNIALDYTPINAKQEDFAGKKLVDINKEYYSIAQKELANDTYGYGPKHEQIMAKLNGMKSKYNIPNNVDVYEAVKNNAVLYVKRDDPKLIIDSDSYNEISTTGKVRDYNRQSSTTTLVDWDELEDGDKIALGYQGEVDFDTNAPDSGDLMFSDNLIKFKVVVPMNISSSFDPENPNLSKAVGSKQTMMSKVLKRIDELDKSGKLQKQQTILEKLKEGNAVKQY